MPFKAKKLCSHPGCPNTTSSGIYCDIHRVPDLHKRYDRRWREIRNLYIVNSLEK